MKNWNYEHHAFYECVEILYKSKVLILRKVWIQIKSFDFRNDATYLANISIKLTMEFSKTSLYCMEAMEFINVLEMF